MTRQITIEEVKKHKRKSSVWMIIHNDVYDVTSFLEEHPGGEESLMEFAGKDGTQVFEDINHSQDARELMKKFKIGTLPPGQHNRQLECCICRQKSKCSDCSSSSSSHLPKVVKTEKTWRTFDGSSSSRSQAVKKDCQKHKFEPRTERRLGAIIVPSECSIPPRRCRPRRFPCEGSNNYKWWILVLAGAILLGVVLKKRLAT